MKIYTIFDGYSYSSLLEVVKEIADQLNEKPENIDLSKIRFEFSHDGGPYCGAEYPHIIFDYDGTSRYKDII